MDRSSGELAQIAVADGRTIAPFRADGIAQGAPTFIWSAGLKSAVHVRPRSGARSSWYRAALARKAGRIVGGGTSFEVAFEPADPALAGAIDGAFRGKYAASSNLAPMISERCRKCRILPGAA
ncbi:DUF2255 family protein [Mangrovicoccus sp. HB161399]|uniref:DUF2255 family protein n=1 Tax=Mangrovicoccus sp. HB161399 TaxID=2720392 RepID=UPI001555379C|nr:DUF2255 family protein [Mangrovicoccus sp. HB161399]